MLCCIFQTLFLVFMLAPVQIAHAAMSPKAQQMSEENTIRKSAELKGKTIRRITMSQVDETRYYKVEADCIYQFVVDYPLNLFGRLFGMPGPQEFNVEMDGEPNCEDSVVAQRDHGDLRTTIHAYVSKIYDVPIATLIEPSMSLYRIPTGQEKLAMDFRILALRKRLEDLDNCHIETDVFMTIRTVGDLVSLANKHCGSSK